jgi:hypothetical protein
MRGAWAVAVLLVGSAAAAEPGGATVAEAERLFHEARAALDEGRIDEACAGFRRSLAMVELANTLIHVARCDARAGRWAEALARYRQGIALLPPGDERLAVAAAEARALEERIGRPVEPDEPEGPPAAPRPVPSTAPVPAAPATIPTNDEGVDGMVVAGLAVGALGAAGLVVAAATGGLLLARDARIDELCPEQRCSAEGRAQIDGSEPLLVGNAVAWGVGIAGVAAGVVLLVVGASGSDPMVVGPGGVGVRF